MESTKIKKWKIMSFGTAIFMLIHLILLQISMAKYSAFPGANWYQDSNKLLVIIFYSIPILAVLGFTVVFLITKNSTLEKAFAIIKLGFALMTDFVVFVLMLLVYHNPTSSEFTFLSLSCVSVAVLNILLLVFEAYKLRQIK